MIAMPRLGLAALAMTLLAGAGCASQADAASALSQTAARLGEIRSGVLTFELSATTDSGARAGFELSGPFALDGNGSPESLDVEYTAVGPEADPVGIVLVDGRAYTEVGGTAYELPSDVASDLMTSAAGEGGLAGLEMDRWIEDPISSTRDGEMVITGDLRIGALVHDLAAMSSVLGASGSAFDDAAAADLDQVVRSSTIEIVTDADDHLLRRLEVDVELAADLPPALAAAAEGLEGARITLVLAIERPNEAVEVDAPASPLPFDELQPS